MGVERHAGQRKRREGAPRSPCLFFRSRVDLLAAFRRLDSSSVARVYKHSILPSSKAGRVAANNPGSKCVCFLVEVFFPRLPGISSQAGAFVWIVPDDLKLAPFSNGLRVR